MFFRKKVERALELQRKKNEATRPKSKYENEEEEDVKLGFQDWLAVFISALLVFGPIFIVLFLLLFWVSTTF